MQLLNRNRQHATDVDLRLTFDETIEALDGLVDDIKEQNLRMIETAREIKERA